MLIRNRLLVVFAVPLLIWVLVSVASVIVLLGAMRTYERAESSQRVVMLALEYRSLAADLRHEERVRLLTDSEAARVRQRALLDRSNEIYAALASASTDPHQLERLEYAGARLQEWFYDISSQLAGDGRPSSELRTEGLLHQSALLVQDFRRAMTEFVAAEMAVLDQRRAEIDRDAIIIQWIIWSGLVLGVVSMITVVAWIVRRIGRSVESISSVTEELARGNMEARLDLPQSHSFVSRFNAMAELIQRRNDELVVLAQLGEMLNSCGEMREAVQVFDDFVERLFPGKPGALYFVDRDKGDVHSQLFWGGGEAWSVRTMAFEDCWALRLGRAHRNRPGGGAQCSHLRHEEGCSRCLPLPAFGALIGLLFCVEDVESDREHGRQFSEMVAQQISLAFANVQLRELLREQAIRDALTGLHNRRHLDEVLRLEIYRAERHAQPLSLLMFDIDHFKKYNDTYGHDGGDAVLRALGGALREFFRPEDGVFRSGGEEFTVLLPATSAVDALERANALCEKVGGMAVMQEHVPLPGVTISIGVASFPAHASDAAQLVKAADQALYAAKEAGRNRAVLAETAVA